MKIGILTISPNIGYGGIMQAYALKTILNKMGHDVIILNRKNKKNRMKSLIRPFYRFILKYILRKDIAIFRTNEYKFISENTEIFMNKHMNRTKALYSTKDIKQASQNLDAVIVGSDQVWRPKYVVCLENYFLNFLSDTSVKKISYASSFGTDVWEYSLEETGSCKKLISKFDSVSVREDSGIRLCQTYFQKKAIQVLDPTLLLSKLEYKNISTEISSNSNSYDIFTYILDRSIDKEKTVLKCSTHLNYTVYEFNTNAENSKALLKERKAPKVEEWILGFINAKYIITDSFHGCVFSIIFNKPFWVYANKSRGLSRFKSLLKLFNLENRLIYTSDELTQDKMLQEIDWTKVNQIINLERIKSINFLESSLK